ncbi:MAG: LamG-like jellyroll fold domain-containing protein [Verrucomicrobiota bacterium]
MTKEGEALIDAYLDGSIDQERGMALQELLRVDPEARAILRKRATLYESLGDLAQEVSLESSRKNDVVGRMHLLPWGIAAVLAVALSTLAFFKKGERSQSEGIVGLLVNEAGARFEEGYGPDEVKFNEGEYRLSEGAIHFRLENGADVVMKSPAAFRIDDSFHMELREGGLRAIVPPSAEGFTVATPGVDYEDLGTEFGVSVDADTGSSELHVYDGQVDAKRAGDAQLLSSVLAGETVAFEDGELKPGATPASGAYLRPGEIGFLRWQSGQEAFVNDADLIAYYAFDPQGDELGLLRNRVLGSRVSDARISDARWVGGRWPGKQALLFDRDGDYAEFDLLGEFEELSIGVWLKLNRLDHELTAIVDSNLWEDGALHFQISRTGTIRAGVKGVESRVREKSNVRMDTWQHVVSVVDRPKKRISVYVNGALASESVITQDGPIIPRACRIGNWLQEPSWPHAPVRALKGRIDEFAIWKRALSQNEVQAQYEAGRPNLLDD